MLKLIIFDWDDTITLGSTKGYFQCYHDSLKEVGVILSTEEEKKRILEKWGQTSTEIIKSLLRDEPELVEKCCKLYEEKLFGGVFVFNLKVLSGTIELLERLSKKYVLCITTGVNPKILRDQIIPKFGFPNIFSQIITAFDISDPKKTKTRSIYDRFDNENSKRGQVGNNICR